MYVEQASLYLAVVMPVVQRPRTAEEVDVASAVRRYHVCSLRVAENFREDSGSNGELRIRALRKTFLLFIGKHACLLLPLSYTSISLHPFRVTSPEPLPSRGHCHPSDANQDEEFRRSTATSSFSYG